RQRGARRAGDQDPIPAATSLAGRRQPRRYGQVEERRDGALDQGDPRRRDPAAIALRNNIRRELVLDEGDAVAQMQLALLQALDLELVEARRVLQCSNRGVEVAMLLLQSRQLLLQLTLFL